MNHKRIISGFLFTLCMIFALHLCAQSEYKKHGRNVIKDPEGNVSVGHSKNYLREGKWYESFPNHTRKSIGKYHLGLEEGRHIAYWPNGNVSSIRDYTNGKHNGQWIELNENGDTVEHLTYNMEVLQGYFFKYDSTAETKTWGNYANAKKSGWWVEASSVATDSTEYRDGVRFGKYISRRLNNDLVVGYYSANVEDSVWTEYHSGKLTRQYWFIKGISYKTSFENIPGTDSIYSRKNYRAPGDLEYYIVYRNADHPQKIEWYSKNHLDSIVEYYPNSKIECRYIYRSREFSFRRSVRQYIGYDSAGHISYIHYCDIKGEDSIHRDFSSTGSLLRELQYVNGAIRGQKYYYANGAPLLFFSSEEIKVYTEKGKQLKSGSAAFSAVFNQFDSLESAWSDRLLFPPIVYGQDVDPVLLAIDLESPVSYADEVPQFPGGSDSLKVYLRKHIVYPQFDKENGNQGTVFVQFVVEKNGMITNVKLIKGVSGSPEMGKEAVRVVSVMPKWSPGYLHGVPVRYQMTLPVAFRLMD